MAESLKRTEFYYGTENVLQNVAVWEWFPEDKAVAAAAAAAAPAPVATKYWLIFVHGGAWCDPRETFHVAQPTIDALLSPSSPPHHRLPDAPSLIAGFASINYRLSPHRVLAQDEDTTPPFATRSAKHPDHLDDVLGGLRFLQDRFGFGSDYVLFGHSAGAFLSFQTLLGEACLAGGEDSYEDVALPAAVVGFEGIYDLVGLNERVKGAYSGLFEPSFGTDRKVWLEASPATAGGSYKKWSDGVGRLAVLAQSPDDELVDMPELDRMEERLRGDGVQGVLVFRDLVGKHKEVLNDGSFARVLKRTLEELERLDKA